MCVVNTKQLSTQNRLSMHMQLRHSSRKDNSFGGPRSWSSRCYAAVGVRACRVNWKEREFLSHRWRYRHVSKRARTVCSRAQNRTIPQVTALDRKEGSRRGSENVSTMAPYVPMVAPAAHRSDSAKLAVGFSLNGTPLHSAPPQCVVLKTRGGRFHQEQHMRQVLHDRHASQCTAQRTRRTRWSGCPEYRGQGCRLW